eukprot:2465077-Amphidinium_carterae.1
MTTGKSWDLDLSSLCIPEHHIGVKMHRGAVENSLRLSAFFQQTCRQERVMNAPQLRLSS